MEPDESDHKVTEVIRNVVVCTVYGVTIYRLLDNLSDGAISDYFRREWYLAKRRYRQEIEIHKETGYLIFEAMEVIDSER